MPWRRRRGRVGKNGIVCLQSRGEWGSGGSGRGWGTTGDREMQRRGWGRRTRCPLPPRRHPTRSPVSPRSMVGENGGAGDRAGDGERRGIGRCNDGVGHDDQRWLLPPLTLRIPRPPSPYAIPRFPAFLWLSGRSPVSPRSMVVGENGGAGDRAGDGERRAIGRCNDGVETPNGARSRLGLSTFPAPPPPFAIPRFPAFHGCRPHPPRRL
jgi:hypothetical protein